MNLSLIQQIRNLTQRVFALECEAGMQAGDSVVQRAQSLSWENVRLAAANKSLACNLEYTRQEREQAREALATTYRTEYFGRVTELKKLAIYHRKVLSEQAKELKYLAEQCNNWKRAAQADRVEWARCECGAEFVLQRGECFVCGCGNRWRLV